MAISRQCVNFGMTPERLRYQCIDGVLDWCFECRVPHLRVRVQLQMQDVAATNEWPFIHPPVSNAIGILAAN